MLNEEFVFNIGPANITVAYERIGKPGNPPALLIMGAGAQMISWPDGFCTRLANRGIFVIRFDNRDAGKSTHFQHAPVPDFPAVMAGKFDTVSYSLSDMAADTIGLATALGFETIHLVGASMGGMIAQTIAIEYPERVKSLTSIMSTTGHPSVGQADFAILSGLGSPRFDNREEFIKWRVQSLKALGSPGFLFDEAAAAHAAALSWDRDHDPLAMMRQAAAVIKSGDRTAQLQRLKMPALVLHGKADKMCDISGGIATAEAIPDASLHIFEGMGHNLPAPYWDEMTDLIAGHILKHR
ncbi:MAG TPA: alpha/beta hydrolase [Chitinophagaceae bacterium]|nr:alpha/beta hydrolase [Chitinophagaceae bacterium]